MYLTTTQKTSSIAKGAKNFFKKCDDPNAQRMIEITFVYRGTFTTHEKELFALASEKTSTDTTMSRLNHFCLNFLNI